MPENDPLIWFSTFSVTGRLTPSPAMPLAPGCDNDWSTWWLGSRTQWNVTKDFYMGFDFLYAKLSSASTFNGLNTTQIVNAPGLTNIADTDNWQIPFPRAPRFLSLIAA